MSRAASPDTGSAPTAPGTRACPAQALAVTGLVERRRIGRATENGKQEFGQDGADCTHCFVAIETLPHEPFERLRRFGWFTNGELVLDHNVNGGMKPQAVAEVAALDVERFNEIDPLEIGKCQPLPRNRRSKRIVGIHEHAPFAARAGVRI